MDVFMACPEDARGQPAKPGTSREGAVITWRQRIHAAEGPGANRGQPSFPISVVI